MGHRDADRAGRVLVSDGRARRCGYCGKFVTDLDQAREDARWSGDERRLFDALDGHDCIPEGERQAVDERRYAEYCAMRAELAADLEADAVTPAPSAMQGVSQSVTRTVKPAEAPPQPFSGPKVASRVSPDAGNGSEASYAVGGVSFEPARERLTFAINAAESELVGALAVAYAELTVAIDAARLVADGLEQAKAVRQLPRAERSRTHGPAGVVRRAGRHAAAGRYRGRHAAGAARAGAAHQPRAAASGGEGGGGLPRMVGAARRARRGLIRVLVAAALAVQW